MEAVEGNENLHYSMFLFKQIELAKAEEEKKNLHYSMFLFKLSFFLLFSLLFLIYITVCCYLNTIAEVLNKYTAKFTLQYVFI